MKRVNIYIGINPASTRKSKKRYGFVMECVISGEPQTVDQFGEVEDTYNGTVLKVINAALRRMTRSAEIHLFVENTFILNMIEKNLDLWAGNGFKNSKGNPLENQEEWRMLWSHSIKHLIATEPGRHIFSEWIREILANDVKFNKKIEEQEKRGKRNV